MKVRITKSSRPTYWYADRIGDVFDVSERKYLPCEYFTIDPMDGCKGYIDKADCEPVGLGFPTLEEVENSVKEYWVLDARDKMVIYHVYDYIKRRVEV